MRLTAKPRSKAVALLLPSLCCAACAPDTTDLQAFVATQAPDPAAATRPAEAPVQPFAYRSAARRSPFAPAVRSVSPPSAKPRHGPLAATPLDEVRLVGTLVGGGERYGLFRDPEGAVHRLAVGDPLGTDGGAIDSISDTAVQLTETVRDGAGGWKNRSRSLALANESGTDTQANSEDAS